MSKAGRTTLSEVMGKKAADAKDRGLSLEDLPELLGEKMPKLEFHVLGRVRLVRALRERFGANYRNIPGVSNVLTEFDKEAKTEHEHHMIRKHWGRK